MEFVMSGPKPKTDLLTKSHELEMDNRSSYVNESRLELLGDSVSISDSELDDTEAPFIKKFATTLVHQGMRPVKETLRTADKLQLFYSTPITKYWLSLVFRLLYLLLFAISISLPSCGEMFTDVALWLWSFCWLLEALFVARIRLRYSHWQQMPWTMFDISCVASFLFVFLANHFTTVTWHHALMTAYTRKSVWAAFLLYQCYSTLFIYVPLSDLFGPLLVRLKLMITRDFVNFLVLISLFVFSSSIAIKAVIFPDRPYSLLALGQSVYWGWMQLFITDMSMLSQSEHCKEMRLSERDFCEKIGGYADPTCPTQSAMGFFTVFEFFVILKLISFPILYALFARTAKVVEDEATSIWKFQMYNLATEFSLRPFMPPPLTPLFLAGLVLLRVFGCISGVFYRAACAPAEHPDVLAAHESDEVDQNKPKGAASGRQHYWTQLAVNYWKAKFCATNSGCKCSLPDDVSDKLNTLSITNSYATAKKPTWTMVAGAGVRRFGVDAELRPWMVLVADYRPPSYSKPTEQFPQSLRTEVDDLAQQTISDFGKQWRQRKLSDVLDNSARYSFSLCNSGLPLNPSGRTGLSGRGNFPKFGPNREMLAVVLATSSGVLPSEWQYGSASVTDFLLRILEEVGVTVIDVRSLSNDGRLPVRDAQESVAHVSIGPLPSDEDTDNAWRESDVWSIDLTGMDAVKATLDNYEWTAPDSPKLSGASRTFVESALRMFNF
ncbi:TRP cation channel protein [Aphelenchoides avenae]|nr:TRP cation channel protein [Aphelenchus avenae]